MDTKNTNQRYQELYDSIKNLFLITTSGELSVQNIPFLTRHGMELLETGVTWKKMKGSEKKDLLVSVLIALIKDLNKDEHIPNDVLDSILSLMPQMIDATVDFAKGYKFKQSCC